MRYCLLAMVICGLSAGTVVRADVESGPAVGEKVPPLQVHAVTGPVENKDVDYAAERKEKPTIYVFIQAEQWSRPMARYLRKLDETVNRAEGAAIVAVWLTGDKEKTKEYLPKAQTALNLQATALSLHPDAQTGPEGWGINADAFLTTVVAGGGKVTATFAYLSVNETDVAKVAQAFRKSLKTKDE